ncbi:MULTISPECIES: TetR/AcrR family transcriptional regulator [unclassified Mycobacterium]|uniref:TetR/AcrR family transcriptional regulator n=1 Tax=unclassified Mycobacterium TaxID=2642494 RepID=UPI0027420DF6|nr:MULTISPECIES: TetR/AcrR family transcriptional regulator [unclassified Mycobacterium]MDP7705907.1 TetR/AcrR family transcriptional regulator [Mycobacterium sp. TY815]MDP7725381.1 TetR/AcrR family transcriptional regulator [Mycobacterium sp. TY814]
MPSVTRRSTANRPERGHRQAVIEQRLLEATERLMAEGATFTELSVDRLASEAGMSRRTFYVYFRDKTQLLRQLTLQVFVEQEAAARQWWESADRHEYADLQRAIRGILASYRRHQALLTAVMETATYDPEFGDSYRALMDRTTANVEQLVIETGKAKGIIRQSLPSHEVAASLTWMLERACHQILRYGGDGVDERLADSLAQIIWASLYLHAPPTD